MASAQSRVQCAVIKPQWNQSFWRRRCKCFQERLLLKSEKKQAPAAVAGDVVTIDYGRATGRLIFRAFPRDKGDGDGRDDCTTVPKGNATVTGPTTKSSEIGLLPLSKAALQRGFREGASGPRQRPSQTLGRGVDSLLAATTAAAVHPPRVYLAILRRRPAAMSAKLRQQQRRNGFYTSQTTQRAQC